MTETQTKWISFGELLLVGVIISIGFPVSVVLPLLVAASASLWLRKSSWIDVGLDIDDDTLKVAGIGLVLGAAAQFLTLLIVKPELENLAGRAVELNHLPPLRGNAGILVNSILLTWATVLAAEMVFRGFLIHRVAELVKDKVVAHGVGVVISAGLFAWVVGGGRLEGIVGGFIAGLGYGYLYLACGRRLVLPIAFHGAFETVNLIFIYMKVVD